MTQSIINRLTYERIGILLTDAPAYKTSGTIFHNLTRVQDINYSFAHQLIDIKSVGSDKLMKKDQESPMVRQPEVNVDITYLFSQSKNEEKIGLYVGSDYSILKNFFSSPTDDINIIIASSNKTNHEDINYLTNFYDFNVVGIGNCFLSNFRYQASVGQLPTVSISYKGSNMKFDQYDPANKPTLPAIQLGMNNQDSQEEITLNQDKFGDGLSEQISSILPANISINITKVTGNHGGSPIESVNAAIQNINIDLPIDRQDIFGFGSNYVFDRKIKLPIVGQASIDMILREYSSGEIDSFFQQGAIYDIEINHLDKTIINGSEVINSPETIFKIEGAQLRDQAFESSIGDSTMVSTNLSFEVSETNGLKLYLA
jgi:hypothetical protein